MEKNDDLLGQFLSNVKGDLDSPINSNFGSHVNQYRLQCQQISDDVETDSAEVEKLKKCGREVEEAMSVLHRALDMFALLTKQMGERWSQRAMNNQESDSALTLLKMSSFMEKQAEGAQSDCRSWHNHIVHPLEMLSKAMIEIRCKNVDKASRDFDMKYLKCEKDSRQHSKQCGYSRGQLSHGELAEQLAKERLTIQYELCKFLLAAGSLEDKRGPQLLRNLIQLLQTQEVACEEKARMFRDFRDDFQRLQDRLPEQKADTAQKRNALFDLKSKLETAPAFARTNSNRRISARYEMTASRASILSTVGGVFIAPSPSTTENNNEMEQFGAGWNCVFPLSAYLYKKSAKKLHKQWQKRRCRLEQGHFLLYHSDESLAPNRLRLLISDCKPSSEDTKLFDLYCHDRTYHLQAESEVEAKRWILALKQEIARVKTEMLNGDHLDVSINGAGGGAGGGEQLNGGGLDWSERRLAVELVKNLPGNQKCADCNSIEDVTWLSNRGSLVCIACSGVHRELGVHVSRIQSLDLDFISPADFLIALSTGNNVINRVFEYDAQRLIAIKPNTSSSRSDRKHFIENKYKNLKYANSSTSPDDLLEQAGREKDALRAYEAVINGNGQLKRCFGEEGILTRMVRDGDWFGLVMIELMVQNRVEVNGLESLLTDAIHRDWNDHLSLLLRCRSSKHVPLQPLLELANKLNKTRAVKLITLALAGERSLLEQITLPRLLLISSPFPVEIVDSSSPRNKTDQCSNDQGNVATMLNLVSSTGNFKPVSSLPSPLTPIPPIPAPKPQQRSTLSSTSSNSSISSSNNVNDPQPPPLNPLLYPQPPPLNPHLHPQQPPLNPLVYPQPPPLNPRLYHRSASEFTSTMPKVNHLRKANNLMVQDNPVLRSSSGDAVDRISRNNNNNNNLLPTASMASKMAQLSMANNQPPSINGAIIRPPVPAPRRNAPAIPVQRAVGKKCRALYDCLADNGDELSFRQGDVIVISRERIDGEHDTWMEGYLFDNPQIKGVFPVTFVTFQFSN